jgi:hypothetical protein
VSCANLTRSRLGPWNAADLRTARSSRRGPLLQQIRSIASGQGRVRKAPARKFRSKGSIPRTRNGAGPSTDASGQPDGAARVPARTKESRHPKDFCTSSLDRVRIGSATPAGFRGVPFAILEARTHPCGSCTGSTSFLLVCQRQMSRCTNLGLTGPSLREAVVNDDDDG